MEELLKVLDCDLDEIEWIMNDLKDENITKIENIIKILLKNQCNKDFIKEVIFNHKRLFKLDLERINYIIEAILSNGDIIEETLLELV